MKEDRQRTLAADTGRKKKINAEHGHLKSYLDPLRRQLLPILTREALKHRLPPSL